MKKIISYILSVFIVLQAASGFALAENSAGAEYHIPESDYLYVDGDNRIRTVEGEQTLLFRLFVGEPQRVHILTSGVNVTLVIYNEAADAVVGAFTSVDGLLDAPFDAAPGSYLLGLSGWGEVAILAASEARTAQIYAQTTAPAPADETDTPAEEAVTEESTEEPAETPAEEPAEAEASESELTPTELTDEPPAAEVTPAATDEVAPAAADESTPVPAEATEQSEALGESDEPLAAEDTSAAAETSSKEFATEETADPADPDSSETVEESSDPDSPVPEENNKEKGFLSGFVNWLTGSGSSQPQTDASLPDEQPEAATAAVSETADATAESSDVSDTVDETETADVSDTEDEAEATADAAQPVDEAAAADEAAATDEAAAADEAVTTTGTIESAAAELTEETLSTEHSESNLSEPAFDPTLPINATIPMNQTVSLLSILSNAGAPVNVITYMSGETEGRLVAVSQSGDWLLTPYAYYDSLTLTVTATDYLAADSAASAVTLTVILSNPNPAAADTLAEETSADESVDDLIAEKASTDESSEDITEELSAEETSAAESSEELTEETAENKPATDELTEEPAETPAEESTEAEPSKSESNRSEPSPRGEGGSSTGLTDEVSHVTDEPTEQSEALSESDERPQAPYMRATEQSEALSESEVTPAAADEVLPGARVTVDRVDINEICLRADVSDFANPDVLAYQWQYSLDGETWMDIPGATESTFSFALDETSSTYYWRLLTSEKDVTLNG